MSTYRLSRSSVKTIQNLIGMSSGSGGTPLEHAVNIDLLCQDDEPCTVQIPRHFRVRWSDHKLQVRQADGGMFFTLSVHDDWSHGDMALEEVSSRLRRRVRRARIAGMNKNRLVSALA